MIDFEPRIDIKLNDSNVTYYKKSISKGHLRLTECTIIYIILYSQLEAIVLCVEGTEKRQTIV